MDPRIEYENPVGPTASEPIAGADRVRGEREKRRQNGSRRRSRRKGQHESDESTTSSVGGQPCREKLGKRIDLEA